VEIDDLGVPIAYHIRKAQQNDWYNTVEAMTWERIEREEPDGWRRVIHDYERDRANQHRGIGVFTPVLAQMKMLARYYGVELQAAVIAASLGTYVKSPYDPALIQDAIAGDNEEELNFYQQMRADWNKENPAMFNGARIPTLAPGESIEQVASAHPHDQFTPFAQEMQRMFASATGLASQQITQDYSQANYSSMRAALAEVWKTLTRRGDEFKKQTATPAFAVWLEEEYERGDVPMPRKRPSYREARTLLARCKWLGPGRGYIDRTKEAEGSLMEMTIGATTLEDEVGESSGNDWEETLDQRQIETAAFKARGLPVPEWNGVVQTAGKTEGRGSHDPTSKNYEPNS
jgi:lambda family phage portal protein